MTFIVRYSNGYGNFGCHFRFFFEILWSRKSIFRVFPVLRCSVLGSHCIFWGKEVNTECVINGRNGYTVGIWIPPVWIQETFDNLTFWSSDFKCLCIQMVRIQAMSYVQDRPFKYRTSTKEKKMACICSVFKWLGCPVFKWHLKTRPFGVGPLFDHLNTRLSLVFRSHCIYHVKTWSVPHCVLA